MNAPENAGETGFKNRRRKGNFTTVPNEILRNPALSMRAKCLLMLMLSFPDDWRYYMSHLESLSSDGRKNHQQALKELMAHRYVVRQRVRGARGRIGWEYEVSDEPIPPEDAEARQRLDRLRESADGGVLTVECCRSSADGKVTTTKTENEDLETKTDGERKIEKKNTPSADADSPPVKTKEAGKPRPPSAPKKGKPPELAPERLASLLAAWNDNRGPLAEAESATGDRLKDLRLLVSQYGEETEALLAMATRVVAEDPWWAQKDYTLSNLARQSNFGPKLEIARKQARKNPPPSPPQGGTSASARRGQLAAQQDARARDALSELTEWLAAGGSPEHASAQTWVALIRQSESVLTQARSVLDPKLFS